VINNISKDCNIPPSDRSADGELKLASFCSSGIRCSALGRLDLVHPHALNGVLLFAPPPPHVFRPLNYHANDTIEYISTFFLVFLMRFHLYRLNINCHADIKRERRILWKIR